MKISIGYSDSQDRMWLRAGSEGPLWWLTRRLCIRLIAQWAELLERTIPLEAGVGGAASTSAESDERRAGALREHRAALEAPAGARGKEKDEAEAKGEAASAPAPGFLVYSVELTANSRVLRLSLLSGAEKQAIEMPRADAHRLLAALVGRCQSNGWVQATLPPWFREEGRPPSE